MRNRDIVPFEEQEDIINQVLAKKDNKECADCKAKSPTWASLSFGVVVCLRCAGYHRHMGPTITKVKSTKLDSWERKQMDLIVNMTNKMANDFYEYNLPRTLRRVNSETSDDEYKRFMTNKYIKKNFVSDNHTDPVSEYNKCV